MTWYAYFMLAMEYGPFLAGCGYYAYKLYRVHVRKMSLDIFYDPIPMRIWMVVAFLVAFCAAGEVPQVAFYVSPFLVVLLFGFINHDFGTNI